MVTALLSRVAISANYFLKLPFITNSFNQKWFLREAYIKLVTVPHTAA